MTNTNPNLVDAVYDSFVEVLDKIETKGIDRVVLSLAEFNPESSNGRFINEDETHYYPFELLTKEEQEMILRGSSYQVISLVRKKVFGQVEYSERGLEVYHRTRINPFLPLLKSESNLLYVSEGRVFSEGDGLRDVLERVNELHSMIDEANRIINASSSINN